MNVITPGSKEAINKGCLCPILDNNNGEGAWGTQNKPDSEKLFWINSDCPLHGKDSKK